MLVSAVFLGVTLLTFPHSDPADVERDWESARAKVAAGIKKDPAGFPNTVIADLKAKPEDDVRQSIAMLTPKAMRRAMGSKPDTGKLKAFQLEVFNIYRNAKDEHAAANAAGDVAVAAFEDKDVKAVREMAKYLEDSRKWFMLGNDGARHYSIQQRHGFAALLDGDLEAAGAFLLESTSQADGTPTLSSFGPGTRLADELLKRGEKKVVLKFLKRCSDFWTLYPEKVDRWTQALEEGRSIQDDEDWQHQFAYL